MAATVKLPPRYEVWEPWIEAGGQHSGRPRPSGLPKRIPREWFALYAHRHPAKPKPHPPTPTSVFGGVGFLTAWDPHSALRLKGIADWIALSPQNDWGTKAITDDLRDAKFDVHVWEPPGNAEGQAVVDRLGATGYIGQAESPSELGERLHLGSSVHVEKILVGNPGVTGNDPNTWAWPAGWGAMPEAYQNANPNATPAVMQWDCARKGASVIVPCFGLYDASTEQPGQGRRVPLSVYLAELAAIPPVAGWCGYLAETLTDDDVAALRQWQGQHP